MATGAIYHTDIGLVLALLSNQCDKPHGVPADIIGRTAKLGYVFYQKTNNNKSRIDLYLVENGKSALEELLLRKTREIPVIKSDKYDGLNLNVKEFPHFLEYNFSKSPVFKENHIPDVHDVLWYGKSEENNITPVNVSKKVFSQLQRAFCYDIFKYYEHKARKKQKQLKLRLRK